MAAERNECHEDAPWLYHFVKVGGDWWNLCYECNRSWTRGLEGVRFRKPGGMTATS